MELIELLKENKIEVLEMANKLLNCAHLKSYDKFKTAENKERLEKLYDYVISSIESKSLIELNLYVEKISEERFQQGFNLHEVHSAFNALEEVIWKVILEKVEKEKYGEYLSLVSTILGAGKETLALKYISLSTKTKVKTLDLSNLFER